MSTATMSPKGRQLLGAVRRNLELLTELEKSAPGDVEIIVGALFAHIRSKWPIVQLAAAPEVPK